MREGFFDALLSGIGGTIARLARGLKDRVWGFLRGKTKVSHKAVMKILRSFDKPYLEALGTAMETVTGKAATPESLARFLIGEVTLSNRLYRQSRQTASEVQRILRDHVKYAHDARKLALDLYEGYNFREREVLVPKVRLPKYLADAALHGRVDALLARIQASQLKTAPLRAAYIQALDQILKESGEKAIERALEVAVQERYRYFANRIAVTELARAHMDQIAREIMDDGEVEIVQVVMSATHPAFDVCDLFAKQNKYGLGPGCYPKSLSPKPIFHPFCRCGLLPRRDLTGTPIGPERPEAAQVYLRSLDPREAARVAGSRAKREEILKGASPESVFNAGRPKAYRIGVVGDVVGSPVMTDSQRKSMQDAREALVSARDAGVWGTKNLNRNKARTAQLVDELEKVSHQPEVATLLARIRSDPTRVDSRELHYIQRRYQDGEALENVAAMDALYRRILSDSDALVHRKGGIRYQVRSPREGWNAIFDPDGTRVSLYPDHDDDFGESLWRLSELIR